MSARRLWHYTVAVPTLLQIVASNKIRRTRTALREGERAAVWFSFRESWEPTATKGIVEPAGTKPRTATFTEMVARSGALLRLKSRLM